MDNALKEKVIEGLIEYLSDIRFVCGKTEVAEFRLYMKEVLSNSDLKDYVLPDDIPFYVGYTNFPVEHRRAQLSEFLKNNAEQARVIASSLIFKTLSNIVSGAITLAEVEETLSQFSPPEIVTLALKKVTKELDMTTVLKLEPRDLGLLPGSVAGKDERLRKILSRRQAKQNDGESDYQQDLAVALWECSESKDLDKFMKRSYLRILRKTIADMPEINGKINENQRQEEFEKKNKIANLDFAFRLKPKFQGDSPFQKEVRAEAMSLDSLPDVEDSAELSKEEAMEAIVEALNHKGIKNSDLTPKEWAEIYERQDLVREGYEFSSKTGISISSFYGKAANAKEKRWSRLTRKMRDLENKPK